MFYVVEVPVEFRCPEIPQHFFANIHLSASLQLALTCFLLHSICDSLIVNTPLPPPQASSQSSSLFPDLLTHFIIYVLPHPASLSAFPTLLDPSTLHLGPRFPGFSPLKNLSFRDCVLALLNTVVYTSPSWSIPM
jgi:hypothetical protein